MLAKDKLTWAGENAPDPPGMPCNESSRGRDFTVESDGQILRFTTMPVQVKEWVSCTKPVRVMK